jgi:hypothetical protein
VKAPAPVVATALVLLCAELSGFRSDAARSFLAASFNLVAADIDRVNAGHVISQSLPASDKREIATMGVMRVRITPEFYAQRIADIATFKQDDAVAQIAVFGTPPSLQDVARLTLEESDLRSLQKCRVGDCGVQLSAAAIDRFRAEVNWSNAGAGEQANGVMRKVLVEYVTHYLASGSGALMKYADQSPPLDLGGEFAALANAGDRGREQFPAVHRHLIDYPARTAPVTQDSIYWSKERIGRRSVISVTHLSIAQTLAESPADYVIASKHIYGTHYFDASLGLTILVRDRASSTPATFVIYVNRSRLDAFGGLLGGLARKIVSTRARSLVSDQLARLQQKLERQYETSNTH